jgi:phosphatidate cytidylyltransferase
MALRRSTRRTARTMSAADAGSDSDSDMHSASDNSPATSPSAPQTRQRSRQQAAATTTNDDDTNNKHAYEQLLKTRGAGESKVRKFMTRLVVGWALIFGLVGILYAGHAYVVLLVLFAQGLLFRELVNVRYNHSKGRELPLFRTLQWCWFFVAIFYCYEDLLSRVFPLYAHYHVWTAFGLYCFVFVATVLSLRKGFYRYQVGQITWTVVTLALIIFQMKLAIGNIFAGLFWFLVPASMIMSADTFAYFAGLACGRKFIDKPFLSLSPNKTWEGFIGGFFATLVVGFAYPAVCYKILPAAAWRWLICPLEGSTCRSRDCSCACDVYVYSLCVTL